MLRNFAILTNIPTPYRIPFFNTLHDKLRAVNIKLTVLFCAEREPNRHWHVDLASQRYEWKILPGYNPVLGGLYPHLNPTVVLELRKLQPTWLLVAGAWNTPTMLLGIQRWLGYSPHRLFWSEGHDDAVRFRSGVIPLLRQRVLRSFDGFAVPNMRSEEFIRAQIRTNRPVLRLPNTVDEGFFREARLNRNPHSIAATRAKHGLPVEKVLVTTVAQVSDRKGTAELVDGYLSLPADVQAKIAVCVLGEGPLLSALKARSPKGVLFLGFRQQGEVRDILQASDGFILPTKQDPNPLTVIEAAFCGLPLLISAKAGNLDELVREGDTGLVLPEITPVAISRLLVRFAQMLAGDRERMGQKAATLAESSFTREGVADNFIQQLLHHYPG